MPERAIEEYRIVDEPFYLPVDHEVDLFEAAHSARLPVILKGPTGCGKTRFVEYMAWRLERPLITVACHEDLSSTDLVGRFLIEVSYNPGYQSILKDLKQSTRQRFVAIDFDYPPPEMEAAIVAREGGIDEAMARDLVLIGQKVRNLRGHGLEEGVSTRLLIYAAQLIAHGIPPATAAQIAMCSPITDDRDLQSSIREIVTTVI